MSSEQLPLLQLITCTGKQLPAAPLKRDRLSTRSTDQMTEARISRAQRYPLSLAVCYREQGSADWHAGTTQNLSESGILLLAGRATQENAAIEMRIQLPVTGRSQSGAEVVCRGTVVRTISSTGPGVMPAMAVALSDYRFVRRDGMEQ